MWFCSGDNAIHNKDITNKDITNVAELSSQIQLNQFIYFE